MEETVSIILATHNRRGYLEDAVRSVIKQTYKFWELIIVDDKSEDGTRDWLSQLRHRRIKCVFLKDHSERAIARNKGLEIATGDYIMFLDDDDCLHYNALKIMVNALRKNKDAKVVIGGVTCFGEKSRKIPWLRYKYKSYLYKEVFNLDVAIVGRIMWDAKIIREVGYMNPMYVPHEDLEHLWRAIEKYPYLKAILIPNIVLLHRVHKEQSRNKMGKVLKWKRAHGLINAKRIYLTEKIGDSYYPNFYNALGIYNHIHNKQDYRIRLVLDAIRLDRDLLKSPLWRKKVLKIALRAIIGKRLYMLMKKIKSLH